MADLTKLKPGHIALLHGNEAIARGALEAGISLAAVYPGNPSSEILESLADSAGSAGIYAEWSVNEKVAVETTAAASFIARLADLSLLEPTTPSECLALTKFAFELSEAIGKLVGCAP